MKTLDEVINALSICHQTDTHRLCKGCPYPDDSGCLNALLTDAFDWLRIYQDEIIQYRKDLRNDPLTWDDLKQMEGKPVWVEEPAFFGSRWVIISGFNEEAVFGTSIGSQVFFCRDRQGVEWQAYRKERNVD